jgi:hypothetical protein
MTQAVTRHALGRQEISDNHARGLRRDLFRRLGTQLAPHVRAFRLRLLAARWPHRSPRDVLSAYKRARQSLRTCTVYFNEFHTDELGTICCAVMLRPGKLAHDDGDEPVLLATLYQMTLKSGRISLDVQRCGRISHHAIERMYQRLRTSDHDEVMAELRGALWWVPLLQCAASLSPRSSTIHQLPIPSARGALRCIRDVARRELEVRTFTLRRPDDRVDRSVSALHRWGDLPADEREAAFGPLLREPANRWWREVYQRERA